MTRGLYSFSPTPSWRGLAWGGVLLGGRHAVLGGHAAGHLYGWCGAPSKIDVFVPRRARDRASWRFHNALVPGKGDPPLTLPERTALDMCADGGSDQLLTVLAGAVSSRRTTAAVLLKAARAIPNLRHRALILEVLGDVSGGVMSALEERFRTLVETAHGLPAPAPQKQISKGTRSDVVFEEFMLVIELDGQLGHTGTDAWRDHRRDNRHTVAGWRTLRYGWWDVVTRPCEVVREVVGVLREQGWRGRPRHCASCPEVEDGP